MSFRPSRIPTTKFARLVVKRNVALPLIKRSLLRTRQMPSSIRDFIPSQGVATNSLEVPEIWHSSAFPARKTGKSSRNSREIVARNLPERHPTANSLLPLFWSILRLCGLVPFTAKRSTKRCGKPSASATASLTLVRRRYAASCGFRFLHADTGRGFATAIMNLNAGLDKWVMSCTQRSHPPRFRTR
jgi:hypothetical protein